MNGRTLINGSASSAITVSDRGLAYGDGLFETMLFNGSHIPLWSFHYARLVSGCERLGLSAPKLNTLESEIEHLLGADTTPCVVKLILTRGSGGRGYAPPVSGDTTRILQQLPCPSAAPIEHCTILSTTLSNSARLAGMKHLNRLEQVLAARELQGTDADEGLVCNEFGFVIEAVSANLLVVLGDRIVTPRLDTAGVRGVMRDWLIDNSPVAIDEEYLYADVLAEARELMVCNSIRGVRRINRLDDTVFTQSAVYEQLDEAARRALEAIA
ncbi:MAG: aminodeoxychorismate lyase [Pseudomonadota bacterium]